MAGMLQLITISQSKVFELHKRDTKKKLVKETRYQNDFTKKWKCHLGLQTCPSPCDLHPRFPGQKSKYCPWLSHLITAFTHPVSSYSPFYIPNLSLAHFAFIPWAPTWATPTVSDPCSRFSSPPLESILDSIQSDLLKTQLFTPHGTKKPKTPSPLYPWNLTLQLTQKLKRGNWTEETRAHLQNK